MNIKDSDSLAACLVSEEETFLIFMIHGHKSSTDTGGMYSKVGGFTG